MEINLSDQISKYIENQVQLHFEKALEESEKVQHLYDYKGIPDEDSATNMVDRQIVKSIKYKFRMKVEHFVRGLEV